MLVSRENMFCLGLVWFFYVLYLNDVNFSNRVWLFSVGRQLKLLRKVCVVQEYMGDF